MKRRFIAAILAICLTLALALTGCEKTPSETPTPTPTPTPVATPTPTPEQTPEQTPEETAPPAVEPDDAEGSVTEQGNEALALLAGTYVIDFSPLLAPMEAEITIGSDGAFIAVADVADYYVSASGVVTEENGVFTLTLTEPDIGAQIGFTYDGVNLVYDEDDLEGIITADYFVELMNLLFPNGLPWDLDSAKESGSGDQPEVDVAEATPFDAVAALQGTYFIDLTEAGMPLIVSASLSADGQVSLTADIEQAGLTAYADGILTEDDGIFTLSLTGYEENLRFIFDGDMLVYDENDFETLSNVPDIAAIVDLVLTPADEAVAATEPEPVAVTEPDPAAKIAEIAGFYIIDLEPAGWEVTLAASVDENGVLYAETDIYGIGGFFINGSVSWADDVYTVNVPDFSAKQRFTYNEGVFDYNITDFNKINGVISMTLYSLALTETKDAEVIVEAEEPVADPAEMVAAIAGLYNVDLEPAGWDVNIDVTIEEDSSFYAETEVEGLGGFSAEGTVTWADGVFTIHVPDFSAKLRFTLEDDALEFNQIDFNKIVGLIRMTLYSMSAEAETEVIEVAVVEIRIDPAEMVAAIAGTYIIDLEPAGWDAVIAVDVDEDGALYAETDIYGLGGFYAEGTVTWADDVFTIHVPDFSAKLRFTYADGVFDYNASDFNKINGLLQMTLYSMTAKDDNPVAAISGDYVIDLNPVGYEAAIFASLEADGYLYAETEIAGVGGFYVEGIVTEDNGVYCVDVPDFGVQLHFAVTESGFEYDKTDFAAIEAMIVESSDMYLITDTLTLTRAAEAAPEEMVAAAAGGYIVDLSPLGYDLVIWTWLEPNGYFYAETELEGFGGFYLEGEVTWAEDVYTVSFPDFSAKQRVTIDEDGNFDYNTTDFNKNAGLVQMTLYGLTVAELTEEEPEEEDEPVAEPDPAEMVAAIAGSYLVDLTDTGWDIQIVMELDEEGNFYAETEIEGFGGYYVEGNVTWADDIYTIVVPDFNAKLRFTVIDGVFDYNKTDLNKIQGLARMTIYTLLSDMEEIEYPAIEPAVEHDPAAMVADIAGSYLVDLADAGWDIQIVMELDEDGNFYAETEIEGFGGFYVEGNVTWADDVYTILVPDFKAKLRFTVTDGVFDYNTTDLNKIQGLARMTIYTLLSDSEETEETEEPVTEATVEPDPAAMVADIAGSYLVDLTDAGWDIQIVMELDEDGNFYAETEIEGIGGYYVEGNVTWADDVYTIFIPDFKAKLRFTVIDGVFDYNKTDLNKIQGLARMTIYSLLTDRSDVAVTRTFADGEVPELNEAVKAIAKNYLFDLSPVGFNFILAADLWENGYLFVSTEIGTRRFYIEGKVEEADGVYTAAVPEHGVKLRFAINNGAIEFNQTDLNKIVGLLRMTLHTVAETAVTRTFAEGEVPELNENIKALARIYHFDLSSVGFDLTLAADLWENGYLFVATAIGGKGYYVEGNVQEADGVYTIAVPDHGAKLRFTIDSGQITFNQTDINKIIGLLRMTFHTLTASKAEGNQTSAFLFRRAAGIGLMPGNYTIDMKEFGWDLLVDIEITDNGYLKAAADLPDIGRVYIEGPLTENDSVFTLYNQDFNIWRRFTISGNLMDYEYAYSMILAELANESLQSFTREHADKKASLSRLAGVYSFDLTPLDVPLIVEFAVRNDGSFTASTGAGGKTFYVKGNIAAVSDGYALTVPGYAGKLNFKLENDVIHYNVNDVLSIGQMDAVAALLETLFPKTAPLSSLTGTQTFDIDFMGSTVPVTVDVGDTLTVTTVIDGVSFFVQGEITELDGVSAVLFPDYDVSVRFFTYGDTIYYDKNALDKALAHTAINIYASATDSSFRGSPLGAFADFAGTYIFYLTPWELPLAVTATFYDDGTFHAETIINYDIYSMNGFVKLYADNLCALAVPGYEAEIRLKLIDRGIYYFAEDMEAIGKLTEFTTFKKKVMSIINADIPKSPPLHVETKVIPLSSGATTIDLRSIDIPIILTLAADGDDYLVNMRLFDAADEPGAALAAILDKLRLQSIDISGLSDADTSNYIDYIYDIWGLVEVLTEAEQEVTNESDAPFPPINFAGAYELDFAEIGIPLVVALDINRYGGFMASADIDGTWRYVLGDVVDRGGGYYVLSATEFGVEVGFFVEQGDLFFNVDNIQELGELPVIQDLLTGLMTGKELSQDTLAPPEGVYFMDLTSVGYFMVALLYVDGEGGLRVGDAYDDGDVIYANGYIKNEDQQVMYLSFNGFGVKIPFMMDDGDIAVRSEDLTATLGLDFPDSIVFLQRVKADGRNIPAEPSENITAQMIGSYFVDMSVAGLQMNVFFNFSGDGRFYISNSHDLQDITLIYAEGEVLFDYGTPYLSVPEWEVMAPFSLIDGDIALSPQDFFWIMGFPYDGDTAYIEKVKNDARNVQQYDIIATNNVTSRDGVYLLDLTPAGYDTYWLIVITGDIMEIAQDDGSIIASGYIEAREPEGLFFLSIEKYGVYIEIIAANGLLICDPSDMAVLGVSYDAVLIIAEMIVAF